MKKRNSGKIQESAAVREMDMAWEEFIKGKRSPKNFEEEKKQYEGFIYWYNNVRKQSDTGKTPTQMYKELYGEKPNKASQKPSRITHYMWDENYKEPDDLLRDADYLISQGEYERALEMVNLAIQIDGEDEETILMKAEILNNLNRFDEAERCLALVEEDGNLKAYIPFYRSQRYMFQGNFVAASRYMKEAYELEPNNFDFIIGLANYLYLQNDIYYQEYVERARKMDKKRTEKFLKNFWIEPKEFAQGPFVLALLECVEELITKEKFQEAEDNISFLLMYEHYLDKEVDAIVRGLQIECLLIADKHEEAAIKIEELINLNKKNSHAYFYKANLFYKHSRLDDALREIDICLKKTEKTIPRPDFYLLKSMILKEKGDDDYIYYERKAKDLEKGQRVLKEAFLDFEDKI